MRSMILLFACASMVVGCGSDDPATGVVDPPMAPAVPTGLQFLDIGEDYMLVGWDTAPVPAPGILVQERLAGEETWSEQAERFPGSLTWQVTVAPETTHEIRIAAVRDGVASDWTTPVAGTALSAGYWDVTGGIKTEGDGDLAVSFVFGGANLFRSGGALEIRGPVGFNGGDVLRYVGFEEFAVELDDRGAPSGTYELSFASEGGRRFAAEVLLDATLALPLPVVDLEVVPGSLVTLEAAWECAGADRARLCYGPALDMDCAWVATVGDSTLAFHGAQSALTLTGHRDPADPESDDPADRQFAKVEWGHVWSR